MTTILLIGLGLIAATLLSVWGAIWFRKLFVLYFFALVPLDMLWLNQYYVWKYRPATMEEVPVGLKAVKDVVWIFVLLCFMLWKLAGKRRASFPRKLGLAIGLFVGYEVLQAVRGYFSIGLMGELLAFYKNLLYVPAAYIAVYLIGDPSDLRLFARRYAYLMLSVGGYGFAQMILQIPSSWSVRGGGVIADVYVSIFLNYDMLGWFAGTAFALIVSQKEAFKEARWLYWLTILVSVYWTVASQSRTAIAALCVVALVLILKGRLRRVTAFGLLGAVGLVGLEAVQVMVAPEWLQSQRFFQSNLLADGRFTDLWPYLWRFIAGHPLVGSGLGLFGFETYLPWYPVQAAAGGAAGVDNTYLLITLTGGFIGLGLFFFMLFRLFEVSSRAMRATVNPLVQQAALGIQLALVVSLVYFFSSDFLDSFPMSLHIWFFIGAVGAVANLARKLQKATPPPAVTST